MVATDVAGLRRLLEDALDVACNPPSGFCDCPTCLLLDRVPALLAVAETAEEEVDHLRALRVDVQGEKLAKHAIVDMLSDTICELATALAALAAPADAGTEEK